MPRQVDPALEKRRESSRKYKQSERGKAAVARSAEKYKTACTSKPSLDLCRYRINYYKSSDKRKGLQTQLRVEWVLEQLLGGCVYCGETDIALGLDRIDCTLGHTESNCVCACLRCNKTRSDMPYEAWLVVARAMREARLRGLFGDYCKRVAA